MIVSQGVEGAAAAAHVLSLPADSFGNNVSVNEQPAQMFCVSCIILSTRSVKIVDVNKMALSIIYGVLNCFHIIFVNGTNLFLFHLAPSGGYVGDEGLQPRRSLLQRK